MGTTIYVYHGSMLLTMLVATGETAPEMWRKARRVVRSYKPIGVPVWYRTANRWGFEQGPIRATNARACDHGQRPIILGR